MDVRGEGLQPFMRDAQRRRGFHNYDAGAWRTSVSWSRGPSPRGVAITRSSFRKHSLPKMTGQITTYSSRPPPAPQHWHARHQLQRHDRLLKRQAPETRPPQRPPTPSSHQPRNSTASRTIRLEPKTEMSPSAISSAPSQVAIQPCPSSAASTIGTATGAAEGTDAATAPL